MDVVEGDYLILTSEFKVNPLSKAVTNGDIQINNHNEIVYVQNNFTEKYKQFTQQIDNLIKIQQESVSMISNEYANNIRNSISSQLNTQYNEGQSRLDLHKFKMFIGTKYKYNTQSPIQQDVKQFNEDNKKIGKLILNDINRGLWRFKMLFQSDKQVIGCRFLQKYFYDFFILLWINQDEQIQNNYYQGLTDVFEILFISYFNIELLNFHLNQIVDESDTQFDMATYDFKIQLNQLINVNVVFNYADQIMKQMIQTTKLDQSYFIETIDKCLHYIGKFDPYSHNVIKKITQSQQQAILLKISINMCLHLCDMWEFSSYLAYLYLDLNQDDQAFILQNIFSVSSRIYLPHLYSLEKDDKLYDVKYNLFVEHTGIQLDEPMEQAYDLLCNSVSCVMNIQENDQYLYKFVKQIVEDINKQKTRKPYIITE